MVILDVDDEKTLEFAIVENVQRQDLNAIEEAQGYQRLIDEFSYNQEKLAKFIGKSRSYIANSLRLLALPEAILQMIEQGNLTAGHARPLIGLLNSVDIAKKIIHKKLSVRQAEVLARQFRNKKFRLIQKKDPLILPPDFENLPTPDERTLAKEEFSVFEKKLGKISIIFQ